MSVGYPRNILMTTDTVGGVWAFTMELARALSPHGVRVHLAAMGGFPSADQRREAAEAGSVSLYESDLKLEWMADPWEDLARGGEWLLTLRDRIRPDLVHLNTFAHGSLDWGLPLMVTGHSCVLSWWRAVKGEPAPPRWDRYRETVAAGLASADVVTAPTRAMLAELDRHYGPLPRTEAVWNGVEPGRFFPGSKESFILTAGRLWDEAKNVAAVEQAADRLRWPVLVAGEAEHPDGGTRAVRNVRHLGRLPRGELASWFARAPVYALPARYEPFGLTVLEAALSGCALVIGDIDSLRELWDGAALFVPPDDCALLARHMDELAGDAPLRLSLAKAARRRGLELSAQRMAEGYLALYAGLLDEYRCGRPLLPSGWKGTACAS